MHSTSSYKVEIKRSSDKNISVVKGFRDRHGSPQGQINKESYRNSMLLSLETTCVDCGAQQLHCTFSLGEVMLFNLQFR